MKRDKVFISYSHKDKVWLEELQTILKPLLREQGIIIWDDQLIKTGDLWRAEIDKALQTANIAVLLVSPNFLASDFIATVELPFLLEAAENSELKVCWLLISQCAVETTSLLKFQAAHDLTRPLDTLKKAQRNKVLTDISRTIAGFYKVPQDVTSDSGLKSSSGLSKSSTTDNSSIRDAALKFISDLLEENTLFSAEKLLIDKAEYFVGRTSEQHLIRRSFENCITKKRTETVFIKGDFGTGKTSLTSKFLIDISEHKPKAPLIAYVQCQKEREHEGWLPFITLFKLLIVKAIRQRIISKTQLVQYLLDYCFAWLRLAIPELALFHNKDVFSQDAIQNQFCKFLNKIGREQALVIVIDDLQWADRSTLGLLSYLTLETNDSPILILTAFRPEGLELGLNAEELKKTRRGLLLAKNVNEVSIPFGISVEEYIQKRYHHTIIFPAEFIKKIERFSDGQALYLEQLFALLEQKNLIYYEEENARWILESSMSTPSVPESIEEVLDDRLNGMKEDYREILKMAAVEGEEFTVQIVSKLIKREEEDLMTQLSRLSAESRFIVEEGPQDIDFLTFDFYKFTHRFFREHVYNRLGKDQRRRFHYNVATYLENLAANKRSVAGILAYHFLESHEYTKGMIYAKLAAENAYEAGKWLEAIEWSQEVLKIIDNDKLHNLVEAVKALVIWVNSAEYLGKYDNLAIRIDEFIELVRDRDQLLYAQLLQARASLCYFANRDGGAKYARLAIKMFHELNDFENELDTKRLLADILVDFDNNLQEGIKINRELISETQQPHDVRKTAYNYSSLAWSLFYVGKFQEALQWAQKAYDLLREETSDKFVFGFAHRVIGRALYKLGYYRKAIDHQQEAINFYIQKGDVLEEHWVRFELGSSYLEQSQYEECLREHAKCLHYAQRVEDHEFQAWIRAELATIAMSKGDYLTAENELMEVEKLLVGKNTQEDQYDFLLRRAQLRLLQGEGAKKQTLAYIEEAEKIIRDYGFEVELVRVNHLYSQVHFEKGNFDRAVYYLNQNIELCQRLEVKVELCDSYEQLADLYKKNGDHQRSEHNYQSALSIRRELGHNQKVESILSKLQALDHTN